MRESWDHRSRPGHDRTHPVQVTLRALGSVSAFRRQRSYEVIRGVFAQASSDAWWRLHGLIDVDDAPRLQVLSPFRPLGVLATMP